MKKLILIATITLSACGPKETTEQDAGSAGTGGEGGSGGNGAGGAGGSGECGPLIKNELPAENGTEKLIIYCDECTHTCPEEVPGDPCEAYGQCCLWFAEMCYARCVGCCDGTAGLLRCEQV